MKLLIESIIHLFGSQGSTPILLFPLYFFKIAMCNTLAVVGATGAVGRTMLDILATRKFPAKKIYALASERSAGTFVPFGDSELLVENLADFDFSQAQIALFSAGADVSSVYAPRAAQLGCYVVDNSSHFRYMDDVPLVVSEVNPDHIAQANGHIIANPNCSTMQMIVALAPIQRAVGITRIEIATYQSVSGSGNNGKEELLNQTRAMLHLQQDHLAVQDNLVCKTYPRPIGFNVLPHIDVFQENGFTKEEMKMVWETNKIFADPNIVVNPTCVRVPVMVGHSLALHITTAQAISASDACHLIESAWSDENIVIVHRDHDYPTPLEHGDGTDAVHVGRVRQALGNDCGLNMWVVADNLRKGAALNAVQIAQLLVAQAIV